MKQNHSSSQQGAGSWVLSSASCVLLALAFLPNVDLYILALSVEPSLLAGGGRLSPEEVSRIYYLFTPPALACASLIALIRYSVQVKAAVVAGFIGLFSVFVALINMRHGGGGVYENLRAVEVTNIIFIAACVPIGASLLQDATMRTALCFAAAIVVAIKCADTIVMFARTGGVSLVGDTVSAQADGGTLIFLTTAAAIAAATAVRLWRLNRHFGAMLALGLAGASALVIVGGFRRAAMLRLAIALAVVAASAIKTSQRRTRTFLLVSMGSLGALVSAYTLASLLYGPERVHERILSFSIVKGATYAQSNSLYLDDWSALMRLTSSSGLIGKGTARDYGVARESDAVFGAAFVPLHVGGFELIASVGVIGAVFLSVVLVVQLKAFKRHYHAPGELWLVAFLAVSCLTVAFPFAPPFYYNPQASMLVGLAIGLALAKRCAR